MGVLGVVWSPPAPTSTVSKTTESVPFESIYDAYFPFVWRSVSRLGVPPEQIEDVVQEIFLIAHRKLGEFEGRSKLKTWLYGIALRVARVYRVRARRVEDKGAVDPDQVHGPHRDRPDARAEDAELARILNALLDSLDDDQREVFVLAELEQLSGPEIAETLGLRLNTVYSRLRLARAAFAEATARYRAREEWGSR
jgi:RNA polymerase sigma-70 factor (ECF subfamily)